MRALPASIAIIAAAHALPAAAQDQPANVFDRDHLTVAVAGVYTPSYDGSNDYVFSPVPMVEGKVHGIAITPRPAGVALDLIPDSHDSKIGFSFGPMGTVSFNRNRRIVDPVVRAAGKLRAAIELGASGGVTARKLLGDHDSLTLSADVQWDVNGAYKGMTWSPAVSYVTPVNKAVLVMLTVSAHHADGDYARYYYSVSPAQSTASGLPEYRAKGGWDSLSAGVVAGWNLSGDMRNGGVSLFAGAGYTHMLNAGRDTPYTSVRGDPNQWLGGVGAAYTF